MEIKACNSLEEVRSEIDKLDEQIVELIALRSRFVRQAAKFKASIEEIKAEDRVRAVVDHAREKAIEKGINPNMMEDLYRIMINEMVETEIAELRDRKLL